MHELPYLHHPSYFLLPSSASKASCDSAAIFGTWRVVGHSFPHTANWLGLAHQAGCNCPLRWADVQIAGQEFEVNTIAIQISNGTYQLSSVSELGIPLVLSKLASFAHITLGESRVLKPRKDVLASSTMVLLLNHTPLAIRMAVGSFYPLLSHITLK